MDNLAPIALIKFLEHRGEGGESMLAGRIGQWEKLQYRLLIEPSADLLRDARVSGRLTVSHATSQLDNQYSLRMMIEFVVNADATGRLFWDMTAQVELLTDWLPGVWVYTESDTALQPRELILEFGNPRWDVMEGPAFQFSYNGLRIWLDGVEQTHELPTEGTVTSSYFAPAGLPLSIARLDGSAADGVPEIWEAGRCVAESAVPEASVRIEGGWRVGIGNSWMAFPIEVQRQPALGTTCYDAGELPNIGGSTTWNAFVNIRSRRIYESRYSHSCRPWEAIDITFDIYLYETTHESYESALWIVPNLPKRFISLGQSIPHEYLMYRAPLPKVVVERFTESRRYYTYHPDDRDCIEPADTVVECEQQNSDEVVIHPARAELLYVHDGYITNPLNDPLPETVYCPYFATTARNFSSLVVFCIKGRSDHPWPICAGICNTANRYANATEIHFWRTDGAVLPYYQHHNPVYTYINTHASPFWSYIPWLQDWEMDIDGDGVPEPVPLDDYWRLHQCQHIEHPALPATVRTRRRSYLLLDTLTNGTWRDWIEMLFGVPSGWVGSKRPELADWLLAGELVLNENSAPRWSAQNATLTFTGAGIVVVPTDTTHMIEFQLADFTAEPYLYPALSDRVTVELPAMVYTALEIRLVSAAGETVLIATAPGTHAIPPSSETAYAGTWARDYSAELAGYSEQGSDWDADGVSAATFAEPARATFWQLLGARAGAVLRITVSQSTPTPYLMPYPRFHRDAPSTRFVSDNGAHTYPLIRNEQTLNFGLLAYPVAGNLPDVRPPHTNMTLYDTAALYCQLEQGQSASDTDALLTQAYAWGFDAVETGGSVASLRTNSRAVLLPYTAQLKLWLINDWRECPPLPTLPTRQLDTTTYQFTGNWGQWVYFCAPSHRYYLAPSLPADLVQVEGDSEVVLTLYDRAVGRFHLTKQGIALDGTETLQYPTRQWRIRVSDRWLARTTPFFSHALIPPHIPKRRDDYRCIAVDTRRQLLHIGNGNTLATYHLHSLTLVLQRDYPARIVQLERDSRIDALLIVVSQAGEHIVYLSRDAGDTASEVLRMATEGFVITAVSPHGLWCALYQGADGLLKRTVSLDGGQTWSTAENVQMDGTTVQAKPMDAWYDARAHALMMVYELANGDRRVAKSEDAGLTFLTVLS